MIDPIRSPSARMRRSTAAGISRPGCGRLEAMHRLPICTRCGGGEGEAVLPADWAVSSELRRTKSGIDAEP